MQGDIFVITTCTRMDMRRRACLHARGTNTHMRKCALALSPWTAAAAPCSKRDMAEGWEQDGRPALAPGGKEVGRTDQHMHVFSRAIYNVWHVQIVRQRITLIALTN